MILTHEAGPAFRDSDRERRRFACDEGIPTLYKFTPFDTMDRRKWVLEILRPPHRVYFARPSELNDDLDLRPLAHLRSGASESEIRSLLRAEAEDSWARQIPSPTAEQLARFRLRLATIDLLEFEREALERIHNRLENQYGILSLTRERDLIPMWDEYADKRRGLCIHFRVDSSSPFGFAQRVIYQRRRPALQLPLGDLSEREVADRALLTKTADRWAQEREYRLVRFPETVYEDVGLRVDGRYGYFPGSVITGITVGTDMPEDDVALILRCANQYNPHLRVDRPRLMDLSAVPEHEASQVPEGSQK